MPEPNVPRWRTWSLRGALVYVCCFGAIGYTWYATRDAIEQIKAEGRDRRSQTCTTFETQHLEEVRRLGTTYRYLQELTPAERKTTLNKTVARSLPGLERDAANDFDAHGVRVPEYCDAPNVGLPEPDPVAPKRPASLTP